MRAARRAPRAGEVVRIGCACVTTLNPEPEPNREQEFIRIGYYVNTEYDAPELMEAPPEQIQVRARARVRARVRVRVRVRLGLGLRVRVRVRVRVS